MLPAMRIVGVVLAACGLSVLAGCPHGARERAPRGAAKDGLSIAIYTGYEPAAPAASPPVPRADFQPPPTPAPVAPPERRSVAVIDDRRTVEVGADRTVRLAEVAEGIELASLIVEPLDGRRFVVESCARELSTGRGGAPPTDVTVVTEAGDEISGTYRASPGDGSVVIEDAEGRAHFVRSRIDRIRVPGAPASQVRCTVDADAGAHRVRLAYATSDLSWSASYRVDVEVGGAKPDAATATIRPTYTIAGSGVLGTRGAAVSLHVGLPGKDAAPRLAWRGAARLGADETYVQPAARVVPARVTHLYRGAVGFPEEQPRHPHYWRATSTTDVWVVLELDSDVAREHADLPGGAALVWVSRDGVTRQAQARWPEPALDRPSGIEVRLWPSADLIGFRERRIPFEDQQQGRFVEQYLYSVSNQGDTPATVWVEEELRPGAQVRDVRKMWPRKGVRRGERMRFRVTVAPKKIERLGFETEYRF